MDAVLTGIVAAFFAGMGLYALAAPARLAGIFELRLGSSNARNEIRAVYGGYGIASAAALAYAISVGGETGRALRLAWAVSLTGMAFGRLIDFVTERPERFYPSGLFVCVELLWAGLLTFPQR